VVGRRLHQLYIQKSAQRKGVGRSPGNCALRIETFEVANQQQSKIATGRQTWSPHRFGIKPRTQPLNVRIKPSFVQNLIQPLIKRMSGRCRQIVGGNPYRRLTPTALSFSHGHARDYTTPLTFSPQLFVTNRVDFHHGLLGVYFEYFGACETFRRRHLYANLFVEFFLVRGQWLIPFR
jgi:hypothetical protein